MEIELVGRVGGRTFDERKLEFEVGEGLNVNIPRSNDHMQIYSRTERPCLFYFLRWPQGNWICTGENEEEGGCSGEIFTSSTSMWHFHIEQIKNFFARFEVPLILIPRRSLWRQLMALVPLDARNWWEFLSQCQFVFLEISTFHTTWNS